MSKILATDGSGIIRPVTCSTTGHLLVDTNGDADTTVKCMGSEDGATTGTQHQLKVGSDGSSVSRCMGITGAGAQQQILVETNGSSIIGGGAVKTGADSLSNTTHLLTSTNGGLLCGNTVGDGSGTATSLKTSTDGSVHVVVENSDNVLIKGVQDGTTTQKDAKTNSNGDLRSALIGNTSKDGTGTNYYVLVDNDGKLETSGGGGGGSSNTNLYPTLASITTFTNFAGGSQNSAYIDLTNARNVFVNCIHTGNATARNNFGQDISISMEFTDDSSNTVCYSGSSNPVFAFPTIDAVGDSTGVAVAELNLGDRSDASGSIKGKFARVSCVNNDNSGTGTAYLVDFKVVIDGI
jgi:hypothetical protein